MNIRQTVILVCYKWTHYKLKANNVTPPTLLKEILIDYFNYECVCKCAAIAV